MVLSRPLAESENQLGQTGESKIVSSTYDIESDAVDSPKETKLDSLISLSPLVSWHADCTVERGRQLFLLTPLPISITLSSKCQGPSKSVFERNTSNTTSELPTFCTLLEDVNDDFLESVPIRPTTMSLLILLPPNWEKLYSLNFYLRPFFFKIGVLHARYDSMLENVTSKILCIA